ncbi:hypothetical protein EJ110_NYTH28245 [Nymphaea thermarum]|nr:hypothetical protein EJ110_NYTH28245 [Nymphaea thermarum]
MSTHHLGLAPMEGHAFPMMAQRHTPMSPSTPLAASQEGHVPLRIGTSAKMLSLSALAVLLVQANVGQNQTKPNLKPNFFNDVLGQHSGGHDTRSIAPAFTIEQYHRLLSLVKDQPANINFAAVDEHCHPTSEQMIVDLRNANCITGLDYKVGSPGREAPDDQLYGALNTTVVAAVLIVTLACSTLLNLSGGVHQEGPLAGRAILSTHPLFPAFLAFNVVALLSSLVIIMTQSSLVIAAWMTYSLELKRFR